MIVLSSFLVNHVQRLYSEASRETYIAEERLEDIERTIGVEGVAKLEADSALRGAEQYQPDPSMTQGPLLESGIRTCR